MINITPFIAMHVMRRNRELISNQIRKSNQKDNNKSGLKGYITIESKDKDKETTTLN